MSIAPTIGTTGVLEVALVEARKRIQITPEQLAEARRRRTLIRAVLLDEFGGSVFYIGSLAHGDALDPLTDLDIGIIVPDQDKKYGPWGEGPQALQERAARAIEGALTKEFPRLKVEWRDKKRAVLVRFGDPVVKGQTDFTADVIIALDNPFADGLYIPNRASWDRSDPKGHTEMVKERNDLTKASFAQVVRLVKHWARRRPDSETGNPPLFSWNIKALALGVIFDRVTMMAGLRTWFDYAAEELSKRETADPARVSEEPIHIPKGWKRQDVVAELRMAAGRLARATEFEGKGYPILALNELSLLFNDRAMMPSPDQRDVQRETLRYETRTNSPIGSPIPAAVPVAEYRPRSWGM